MNTLFAQANRRVVLREQEFADGRGELFRMDRVIVDPNAVEVVDFKTGRKEEAKSHREQITKYLQILRDVYPGRKLNGVLAYVDQCAVEKVE